MADRIQLLPDHIANQIAAGEVIQRPASAVKELLENAVDAGATHIQLIVVDAGKTVLQVVDNGAGMSPTDARMAFERHATSKIRNINDLFHIRTMGFRGEALASIAAVAQVELKTKRPDDEVGTYIEIENSVVLKQEPVAHPTGTSLCMKNLFFNVPARRNFLKSNASEMRHVVDEFMRVALAFPEVQFSLTSNGQPLYQLEGGNLKQRIVQLLGPTYNARMVPVKEETDYLTITGFIGKPETAKRTRGDQYFFVNNRFIKSAYLHHAVMGAYHDLLPAETFPAYVLFIHLDPEQVDVNVHPTKQEIKFEDEKIVYAFVQAAVKHALAQFSIAPALDFDLDSNIQNLSAVQKPFTEGERSNVQASALYQTFTEANQAHKIESAFPQRPQLATPAAATSNYQSLLQQARQSSPDNWEPEPTAANPLLDVAFSATPYQLHNRYIVWPSADGLFLIQQQTAHERVLYERWQTAMSGKAVPSQPSMFPVTLQPSPADAVLLQELVPQLQQLGYLIQKKENTFLVVATPADLPAANAQPVLEAVLDQYKHFSSELKLDKREVLLRSLAAQSAIKAVPLTEKEMTSLVQALFSCAQPATSPTGKPTFMQLSGDQLQKFFGR